ncbi:MAG: GNAT family N-acetyltransferase [Oscillospiraceae bacterium]
MTRVYLIRHGEAEGNVYRRAQGHYNSRITTKGYRQIDALAERFRDVPIDALYASDLHRTQETAKAITKYHDLEMHLEPRLREICMGCWEDRPWGDLTYEYPEAMLAFNDDPDSWQAEGAETFPHLKARMRGVVLEIAHRHQGQTVACVSHGMAIRALLSDILGVPSAEIYRVPHGDNTAVALLEIEGEDIRVVFYNDNSHLNDELSTFSRQSWWKKPGKIDRNNVRFVRLDPSAEPETYMDYYAKTWKAVHGDLRGFQPRVYLECAKQHVKDDPDALVTILCGTEPVGITELDTRRGEAEGYGWICLCYVEEKYRRSLLGVQLLGHAVSHFRSLGRRSLRLSVFQGNTGAIAFYEEAGFRRIGETDGACGRLFTMEMAI